MNQITEALVTIFTAIVGVAILAVLVSKNSQTSNVLSAFGGAFSQSLGAATAPVTGQGSAYSSTAFQSTGFGQPGFGLQLPGF